MARECATHGIEVENIELSSGQSSKRPGAEDILNVAPEHSGRTSNENALHG
jgi:hypothetical protein